MRFKILLAIDGSESSMRAAEWLARREARSDSAIVAWTTPEPAAVAPPVWKTSPVGYPFSEIAIAAAGEPHVTPEERARGEAVLEVSLVAMEKRGVARPRLEKEFQPRVQAHDVASLILEAARRGAYDEIVVGRRGLGRFKEWLIGSVSHKLVQHLVNGAVTIVD